MTLPSGHSEEVKPGELFRNYVKIGTVCWSLMDQGVGKDCLVSRYDAYRMGEKHETNPPQRRIEGVGSK